MRDIVIFLPLPTVFISYYTEEYMKKLTSFSLFISIFLAGAIVATPVFAEDQQFFKPPQTTEESRTGGIPEIRNPFTSDNPAPKPSGSPAPISPRIPSDDQLLQQFRRQENGKMNQDMKDKMQQFMQARQSCMQQMKQFSKERQDARKKLLSDFTDSMKQFGRNNKTDDVQTRQQRIQQRQDLMRQLQAKRKQLETDTQSSLAQMRKDCLSTKKQVLGLMTTVQQ